MLIILRAQLRKSNSAFRISGLFSLIRLPLSLMVTFSALTGYLLTGRELGLSFVYLFSGLFLLSAGASVLNQVQEYKLDALMPRTRRRPLPAGEITPGAATGMALFFILTGSLLLSLNGWIPMFLGLLNILFYNLIYTPLRDRAGLPSFPARLWAAYHH